MLPRIRVNRREFVVATHWLIRLILRTVKPPITKSLGQGFGAGFRRCWSRRRRQRSFLVHAVRAISHRRISNIFSSAEYVARFSARAYGSLALKLFGKTTIAPLSRVIHSLGYETGTFRRIVNASRALGAIIHFRAKNSLAVTCATHV